MTEERGSEHGREGARTDAAFDEDPPVDPASRQVGNSKARFFVPSENEDETAAEADAEAQGSADEDEDGSAPAGDEGSEAAAEADSG